MLLVFSSSARYSRSIKEVITVRYRLGAIEPLQLGYEAFVVFFLFAIYWGQFSSSFAGELFLAYLDRADDIVPFEALSYTWGHPEPVDHVTVNGGRLSIANNLSIALPYLRREDRDRILWIDAICIDQDDKKERGHQVQQMGKIFSQADTVVCWLGPATNDTNLVMSNLRLLQQESVRRGHRHLNDSWSSIQRAWADRHDDHNYDKLQSQSPVRQCAGMRLLLESNWFKRVWILQEVANASRAQVQCGSQSVSSRVFSTAPTLLGITPSDHCQAVLDIMPGPLRQGSWYSQQRDLYSLLKHFRGSEALEPRDKIYALLGICSDAEDGDRLLQPDYSKPIGQVIDDAIQHMYAVDMRGEIGYSDMECFLTNLEFINATALSSLARVP
ncbi:hypothetical protein CDD83_3939 [Cordyceps sp. RAO-2017]|nr:hypothetical protein CDD83_3939 [Cordyceps sp. RAO-2017]